MERAFREAQRANVNVYPVDVCGLRAYKAPQPVTPGGLPPPPPTCQPGLELEYLLTIAENTNAHAVVNTSDFSPGIQKMFDENASYYLLGYQPSNPADDGKFRRIEVTVNRPRVEIRTRSGYQREKAKDAQKRRAELAQSPLGAALWGLVPRSGVPLELHTAVFPRTAKKEAAVAIVPGVRQPIRTNTERTTEKVDLQGHADDRVILDRTEAVGAASFASSQSTDVGIDLALSRLAAGEYLLTVEAADRALAVRRHVRFTRR